MTASALDPITFLGCRFNAIDTADLLNLVFRSPPRQDRTCRTIVTINVAILVMSRSDERLAAAIDKADLVVADGTPLVWASRWLSSGLPERITGIDLMQLILEHGSVHGLRVFLLGTTQERLEVLQQRIRDDYPGVSIVGARNGYFRSEENPAIVREIQASRPDILFIGMPSPAKEIWSEEHRNNLFVPLVLGVGGAFDVIAGFVPRAPKLLQKLGFEWAWRLAHEPRRLFKRYLVTNSFYIALLFRELLMKTIGTRRGVGTEDWR
ncbi:WecB/TagA/CpsF family glycosyltransferase [Microvirga alba]|uniref:WecB/TagA/CpsF family glycosyltransferase n=1 Tax=Microvirga alba TaxID=2791025 RepID=A0A931FUK0_9HYPH|nr:WecB/TagA/CpsF family glycosyltransferase [Microvirga alba]MBF9235686.1 WecB/TagA/CpsF family glycosyltransferase [Microvirga alba]